MAHNCKKYHLKSERKRQRETERDGDRDRQRQTERLSKTPCLNSMPSN